MSDYALGPAYNQLLESELFADLEICVNGETMKAHKCVVTSRSEKFNVMLLSESTTKMKEHKQSKIVIERQDISPEIFKEMLRWIYMGEC